MTVLAGIGVHLAHNVSLVAVAGSQRPNTFRFTDIERIPRRERPFQIVEIVRVANFVGMGSKMAVLLPPVIIDD